MRCCWSASPTATGRRCIPCIRATTCGSIVSCCASCATRPAAEDIVSQVFLDVWRTAGQFEGRSQVSTWLLSIARFKALTALRQRRHEDIDQEDVLRNRRRADTPEASLDRSNTSAILRACVAKLSPAHREIIHLVYYHEKSVEEAGEIIGIPQSTVKTRMFYARKQLAELLKGAGVDSLAA